MAKKSSDNNRSHFRIIYPANDRPVIKISGLGFPIIEVSEGGCSIFVEFVPSPLKMKQKVTGVVTFGKRGSCNIAGHVVRVDGDKYSIKFAASRGVPLPRIMEEQRYLIKKSNAS